jgi:hypothetical protein
VLFLSHFALLHVNDRGTSNTERIDPLCQINPCKGLPSASSRNPKQTDKSSDTAQNLASGTTAIEAFIARPPPE